MESFYGGRQGASFVIKKKFKYLDPCDPAYLAKHDFISCDKNSSGTYVFTNLDGETTSDMPNRWDIMSVCLEDTGYQDVWYNEYCIIDTDNKNNPNNGKIFRRVLPNEDYVTPGYEHIGTIVGPSSGAAMLKPQSGLLKLGNIREELAEDNWDGLGILVDDKPVIYDPSFTSEDNIAKSQWPGDIEPKVYPIEIGKGLVHAIDPTDKTIVTKKTVVEDGKTKIKTSYNSNKIVNDIKYNWFNVRKNTDNNDGVVESWCYIGFEIPAPSFTVEALYKTPGTKPGVSLTDNANDFAFWHDIHFDIPSGVRGISIEKFFTNDTHRKNVDKSDQIFVQRAWSFDNIKYDTLTDTYFIAGEDDKGNFVTEDITYNSAGPSTISDKLKQPYQTKSLFCNLRIINPKDNAEGKEWPVVLEELPFFVGVLEEVEYVKFNTDTGHLQIAYHNQDDDTWDIRYPKQFTFATATDKIQTDGEEKEITYNTGKYDIDYSCGQDESGQFGFVRKVILQEGDDEKKGSLTFVNTIDDHTQTYDFSYPKTLEFYKTDNLHDGRWKIDYYGAEDVTGQFGFVKSVSMSEGANNEKGVITFNNTIDDETQDFDFSYPKKLTLKSETGEWDIDYFGAKTESGQIDFVDKAFINSDTGKITFHHTKVTEGVTDTDGNFTQDFIYPKLFELDPDTGKYTVHYSNSDNNTPGQLVFPKEVSIDKNGVFSYVDSAGNTNEQTEKIVFIDDVFVDNAHQLWIAYTDNTQMENQGIGTGIPLDKNGVPLENGKTYINYGQTIGTLGIMSGPMPEDATAKSTIENIVNWFNANCTNGIVDGKVSGKLHVVTTEPLDDSDPISYFVAWNPDAGTWYAASEIAGAPVGVPAQIGGTLTTGGQENWTYADNEEMLADGAIRFVQLEEDEQPLTIAFPWM